MALPSTSTYSSRVSVIIDVIVVIDLVDVIDIVGITVIDGVKQLLKSTDDDGVFVKSECLLTTVSSFSSSSRR